jgi:hypothetical protein
VEVAWVYIIYIKELSTVLGIPLKQTSWLISAVYALTSFLDHLHSDFPYLKKSSELIKTYGGSTNLDPSF